MLYFALMELMLIDSSRALSEAQRFRSRVVAAALAESGAELAAARMVDLRWSMANATDAQGSISGRYSRTDCCNFELTGKGKTSGVVPSSATVRVQGRINGNVIIIDYATHSQ